MKTTSLRRVIAASAIALAGLALGGAAPAPADGDEIRVMFLGDSITGSPGCWRAEVWRVLSNDGYAVDMVGPRTADECGGITDDAANLWDPDNAGYGGFTTYRIADRIGNYDLVLTAQPDLVVMLLGTNDVRAGSDPQTVRDQLAFLIELMRRDVPNVSVVVGTLPPIGPSDCTECQGVLDELNPSLPAWAEEVSTPESPVTVAVIHEDLEVATDTFDDLHPNDSGNAKLAAAWVGPIEDALDAIAARSLLEAPTPGPSVWPWIGLAVLFVAATTVGGYYTAGAKVPTTG